MKLIKRPMWKISTKLETMPASMNGKKGHFKNDLSQETKRELCAERIGAILLPLTFFPFRVRQLNKVIGRRLSSVGKDVSKLRYNALNNTTTRNMSSTTDEKDHQDPSHANDPKELEGVRRDKVEKKGQDKPKDFKARSSLFLSKVNEPYFIDNTMLIKKIHELYEDKANLICGPRRWGKSHNLDMIYDYHSIYQDIPSREVDTSLNPNKAIFERLSIGKDTEFFNQHFGRYPVIYLDFRIAEGRSIEKCEEKLGTEAFRAINRFDYLLNDPNLSKKFKALLNKAEDDIQKSPASDLLNLCTYLFDYYGKKCMILIDEFDLPITNIIQNSNNEKDKEEIVDIYRNFFSKLLKGNKFSGLEILTSILRMETSGLLTGFNNVAEYKLINGEFVDFYGFTEENMKNLLERPFISGYKLDQRFKEEYNGYLIRAKFSSQKSEGQKYVNIYNVYSVVEACRAIYRFHSMGQEKLLDEDMEEIFQTYWFATTDIDYVIRIFKPFTLYVLLQKLLSDKPIYCDLEYTSSALLKMNRLMKVYEMLLHNKGFTQNIDNRGTTDMILALLVSIGYLTFEEVRIVPMGNITEEMQKDNTIIPTLDTKESTTFRIRIPNMEIRKGLEMVNKILTSDVYETDATYIPIAKQIMTELFSTKETEIDKKIKDVSVIVLNILGSKSKVKSSNLETAGVGVTFNERTVHQFFELIAPSNKYYFIGSEVNMGRIRPDLVFVSKEDKRTIIIELKIGKDRVEEAYSQTEKYCSVVKQYFKDSEEVLRIGVNYQCIPPSSNNNETIQDNIQYMFSLHKYKEVKQQREEGDKVVEETMYELESPDVKPNIIAITYQEACEDRTIKALNKS